MSGQPGREVCAVDDCDHLVHGRGLCGKHYQRMKKTGTTAPPPPTPTHCSIDDCRGAHFGRGWCAKHYARWWKHGHPEAAALRPSTPERFWAKVDRSLGRCWTWVGYVMPNGYGTFAIDGVSRLAHRVSYELLVGPIPEGLTIDHLCRNRACVNPAHLEPVTISENLRRARAAA